MLGPATLPEGLTTRSRAQNPCGQNTDTTNTDTGKTGATKTTEVADPQQIESNPPQRKDDKGKRLNGIPKYVGDGEMPFATAAECRSDLDLWRDNYVEADAKWKGKVVEVEMKLDDLTVKNNKKTGQPSLLTQGPNWGRPWQIASFGFAESSRKQLIGIHEKSGIVVIRGECKGLQSDQKPS